MQVAEDTESALRSFDSRVIDWMAKHSVGFTRIALGTVFLWFGLMKFFFPHGESEQLASQTISHLTFGKLPATFSLPLLGTWECAIGLGLLTGKFLRSTILLLLLQMPGTFLPLILFPALTWVHPPYEPTLAGQYIIKNIVLICAGLLVGGTIYGGQVIANKKVADTLA